MNALEKGIHGPKLSRPSPNWTLKKRKKQVCTKLRGRGFILPLRKRASNSKAKGHNPEAAAPQKVQHFIVTNLLTRLGKHQSWLESLALL